jgi:hypothetical protein
MANGVNPASKMRASPAMRVKTVYLNDVPVGAAATWYDVAAIVSDVVHVTFTARGIQNRGNEGPDGFYVTLRLHEAGGKSSKV